MRCSVRGETSVVNRPRWGQVTSPAERIGEGLPVMTDDEVRGRCPLCLQSNIKDTPVKLEEGAFAARLGTRWLSV